MSVGGRLGGGNQFTQRLNWTRNENITFCGDGVMTIQRGGSVVAEAASQQRERELLSSGGGIKRDGFMVRGGRGRED